MKHSRIGNGLPHVVETADPGDNTLYAHAESPVRHAAVPPQIEIPLEGLLWQLLRRDPFEQRVVVVDPLSTSDNLTVAFRGEHVD